MSATSAIEWTDRTWNPVRGCSIVSPGCVNCYAMKQAHRFSGPGKPYEGLTKLTKAGPQWTGKVRTVDAALLEPLSWRKPARVFVNSMSDLFHEAVPDEFIGDVFGVMAMAPKHTFQILTKRPERMLRWVNDHTTKMGKLIQYVRAARKDLIAVDTWPMPLPNVWLGVSVENQEQADARIPLLLQTPASVRFVSAEPLLGPIDLKNIASASDEMMLALAGLTWGLDGRLRRKHARLEWVIVGGESGPGARPFDLAWARSITQQCKAASVACFVKQLGKWPSVEGERLPGWMRLLNRDGSVYGSAPYTGGSRSKHNDPAEWPEDLRVREFPATGKEE